MKYTNKNLTVMFTDICGFTAQTGKTSRSELMERLGKHNALLLPIIEVWGGTLIKSIGDAFLLTFESPTDALHCALCLQDTLREYNRTALDTQKIHIKISVNSGEITKTEHDVFGDPVNVAAKIEKAAQADETLFTEAVFLSMNQSEVPCERAGTFATKGQDAPETVLYRLVMNESNRNYNAILSAFNTRLATSASNLKTRQASNIRHAVKLGRFKKMAGLAVAACIGVGVTFMVRHTQDDPAQYTVARKQIEMDTAQGELSIKKQLSASVEPSQPTEDQRNSTLAWAKLIVEDSTQLKQHSNAVIGRITNEFQTRLDRDTELQNLLRTALSSRIYWEAREKSFSDAGKLLDMYKTRYMWIKNWANFEREQHLGGLHNLSRDQWRSRWNDRWFEHYQALKQHADNDPDFGMRVALEISSINIKHNKVAAPEEQDLVSTAVRLKPELLNSQRNNLITLTQSWLKIEQENSSYARELARKHLYQELRPWLITGLKANNPLRSPPEPDFPLRQNCLALLADQRDVDAVGNLPAYFQDNIPVFMRATETVKWGDGTVRTLVFLTEEQIRRVLELPMNDKEKTSMIQRVDKLLADIESDQLPWGGNNDARQVAQTIKAMLLTR